MNGTRFPKSNELVEAYGTLDELNAFVGLLRDELQDDGIRALLLTIQEDLFVAEALIATDPEKPVEGLPKLEENSVKNLENEIDIMAAGLPKLNSFILPGGDPDIARCHIARTVCRRAERCVIRLHHQSPVSPVIIQYLNRLSDLFFMMARKIAQDKNIEPITWPRRQSSEDQKKK